MLIVISHDRHFLNSVCTHIADIDYDTIIVYPGNYDEMVEHKMQASTHRIGQSRKSKKIAQLQEFVAKFAAGQRSSQVQSRKKRNGSTGAARIEEVKYSKALYSIRAREKTYGARNPFAQSGYPSRSTERLSQRLQSGSFIAVTKLPSLVQTVLEKQHFLRCLMGELEPDSRQCQMGR